MTRYYRYLDLVMRARVFYRVLGKSVRYVFGIKPIILPYVAGPTTYEPITTASLLRKTLQESSFVNDQIHLLKSGFGAMFEVLPRAS